jgi:hypothetical protein
VASYDDFKPSLMNVALDKLYGGYQQKAFVHVMM